jgi:hypothetical protein
MGAEAAVSLEGVLRFSQVDFVAGGSSLTR